MKSFARVLSIAVLGLVLGGVAAADTLELKDGRVLQGRYLGGTQVVLRFEVNGDVQTFKTMDILALTFTAPPQAPPPPPVTSVDPQAQNLPSAPAPQPMPANNMAPAQSVPPTGNGITVPAGQSMLVRMIDGVDSSKNNVGDVFHASLETDLNINGVLVARKGADIYGRLAEVKEAGHFAGSAELQLELSRIVIDGKDYPVVSSDYSLKGKGRGGDTAKKVGGGAVAGAIIGAIAGGGKGAAIGTGVGAAAGGGVQVFTRGKQVKVPSETLLEFRLQQPVTVTPVGQ